jgi:hypothetical protein
MADCQHDHFKLHSGGRLIGALIATPFSEGIVHAAAGGDVVRMLGQLAIERGARIFRCGLWWRCAA